MPSIPGIEDVMKMVEARGPMIGLTLVGSQAYGLAKDDSDHDLLGVYMAPTAQVLSLPHMQPKQTIHKANVEGRPDFTVHEVGKFLHLAAAANPTVLEWLFLEPAESTVIWADELIRENRDAFISTAVRRTYGGYARQQLIKRRNREAEGKEGYSPKTHNRVAKHTRHIVRLFLQEQQILSTGGITPFLNDEERELVIQSEHWSLATLENWMVVKTLELLDVNNNIPPEPDYARINEILLEIRGL